MNRLRKQAEVATPIDVEVGDTAYLEDDEKYKNLDMNDLSKPQHRDGIVLVDTKENVVHWGLNGETHDQLFDKYYSDVISDTNEMRYETDNYVASGVYLKDFLGHETVILYSDDATGAENVLVNNKPGIRVFVDDWDDGIQRIAEFTLVEDAEVGEDVDISMDQKYEGLTIDDLSIPSHRDGAILVDTKDGKLYWGMNGETHADLVQKIYNVDKYNDDEYDKLDIFLAYGIYLKDFIGHETIVLYWDIPNAIEIVQKEKPGIRVYIGTEEPDILKRIAEKRGVNKLSKKLNRLAAEPWEEVVTAKVIKRLIKKTSDK